MSNDGHVESAPKKYDWETTFDKDGVTVKKRYVAGERDSWMKWRVQYGKDTATSPNSLEDAMARLVQMVENRHKGSQ